MLTDFVAQSAYIQFDLRSALMRSWLKQPRARDHTNLYLFTKGADGHVQGSLLTAAPFRKKPWGISLPAQGSMCSCSSLRGLPSPWRFKHRTYQPVAGEVYFFYVTECCKYELHLAIFVGPLTLRTCHGTEVVIEPINSQGESEFDYGAMVAIKHMVRQFSFEYSLRMNCRCFL